MTYKPFNRKTLSWVREMQNPCFRCPERSAECHGTCIVYKAWKEHHEKLLSERPARYTPAPAEHYQKRTK